MRAYCPDCMDFANCTQTDEGWVYSSHDGPNGFCPRSGKVATPHNLFQYVNSQYAESYSSYLRSKEDLAHVWSQFVVNLEWAQRSGMTDHHIGLMSWEWGCLLRMEAECNNLRLQTEDLFVMARHYAQEAFSTMPEL